MIWLFIWLPYALGWAFTFRRITGQIAWHCRANAPGYRKGLTPSGEQWAGAVMGGFVSAIIWPLSLPCAYALSGAKIGGGFYCPPDDRNRLQKERIKELERAAGIYDGY